MKKKQLNRKLSLNKQTLSNLDATAMHSIKGGMADASLPDKTKPCTDPSCRCA